MLRLPEVVAAIGVITTIFKLAATLIPGDSSDYSRTALPDSADNEKRMLRDAMERVLALTADYELPQLLGPRLAIVNPPLWELGHLAWFTERWCLRHRGDRELAPSIIESADRFYDSSVVAHDTRWDLPLLDIEATKKYIAAVQERVLERIDKNDRAYDLDYFARLATFHLDMHAEAFFYTRQTLGYPAPGISTRPAPRAGALTGDVEVAGGEFRLGAEADDDFVFDNEKWAHPISLGAYSIARAPVTNAEYLAFAEDGGYARRECWSEQGWTWRLQASAQAPVYWIRYDDRWMHRVFDEVRELNADTPILFVNWFEADAYCRWAGRRLPSEVEWERAAAGAGVAKPAYPWGNDRPDERRANLDGMTLECADVGAYAEGDSAAGCRQMLGNVWEWTADWFAPYPGFVRDPYKEYSEPWFGNHKVLRGGCFVTRSRLIRNTWRNFYMPDRRDVLAGFRTCAL